MQLRPSSHAHVIFRPDYLDLHPLAFCDQANQHRLETHESAAEVHVCREGVSMCCDSNHRRYEDLLVMRVVANEGAGHVMKGNLGERSRRKPVSSKLWSTESL